MAEYPKPLNLEFNLQGPELGFQDLGASEVCSSVKLLGG